MALIIYKWYGEWLRRAAYPNKFGQDGWALNVACCCESTDRCCDRPNPGGGYNAFPTELKLVLTDVTDCSCIDGDEITLTWDSDNDYWEGDGPGGGCALEDEKWRLQCNINDEPGESDCATFTLLIVAATSCIQVGDGTPNPATCTCDPLYLEFNFTFNGLSCCSDSMDGTGSILAVIDENDPP